MSIVDAEGFDSRGMSYQRHWWCWHCYAGLARELNQADECHREEQTLEGGQTPFFGPLWVQEAVLAASGSSWSRAEIDGERFHVEVSLRFSLRKIV